MGRILGFEELWEIGNGLFSEINGESEFEVFGLIALDNRASQGDFSFNDSFSLDFNRELGRVNGTL